jgi:hypothetical protein
LDSCVDVTLISETFHESLKFKPKLRQGMHMKLYGLIESSAKMKGYVLLPIFMTTTTEIVIETQAEAYVVPGMSMPKDYQTAYELSVFRNVESGLRINFSNTSFDIPATGIDRSDDAAKLRKSAFPTEGFLKAKTHRRDKMCHHRRKQALLAAAQCI